MAKLQDVRQQVRKKRKEQKEKEVRERKKQALLGDAMNDSNPKYSKVDVDLLIRKLKSKTLNKK